MSGDVSGRFLDEMDRYILHEVIQRVRFQDGESKLAEDDWNRLKLLEELLLEDDCVMKEREHNVFVDSLGESAVVLGCRGWVRTEDYWPTRWRLLEAIKLTLDDNGIEIPYQQMNIHIKGGEKV